MQNSRMHHSISVDDGRLGLAIAAGMGAAIAGGLIWAAVVVFTGYELGIIAWGIGLVVGAAMGWATVRRGAAVGTMAAGIAVTGLLLGNVLISIHTVGTISSGITGDPEYLQGALAWEMYGAGELDPATMESVESTFARGDTLSDALWMQMGEQAAFRLSAMTPREQQDLSRAIARGWVSEASMVSGLPVTLTPWDLLWFGLALYTAFRMMAAREEEPIGLAEAEEGGEARRTNG